MYYIVIFRARSLWSCQYYMFVTQSFLTVVLGESYEKFYKEKVKKKKKFILKIRSLIFVAISPWYS